MLPVITVARMIRLCRIFTQQKMCEKIYDRGALCLFCSFYYIWGKYVLRIQITSNRISVTFLKSYKTHYHRNPWISILILLCFFFQAYPSCTKIKQQNGNCMIWTISRKIMVQEKIPMVLTTLKWLASHPGPARISHGLGARSRFIKAIKLGASCQFFLLFRAL